jgi:formate hydrogenlyase subunit 3/multisubunit Na+/H+ antiporter MnhD subunit
VTAAASERPYRFEVPIAIAVVSAPLALVIGAALVLLVRRWTVAVKACWVVSALAALVLVAPMWPVADLRAPWFPGTPDVALPLALHVDALTIALAAAAAVIAVATALADALAAPPWRVVVGRQLAYGVALLVIAAADLAVAASAVLLLPVASGLAQYSDDERALPMLGALLAAGMALLAAASFGAATLLGFLALLGAAVFLLFQAPFVGLGEVALGGRAGAFPTNVATLFLPALAIVIRFGVESSEPWRLQLWSAFGVATMVWAGFRAAQSREMVSLLAALASLHAGASLVALGQGIAPTQPAAIVIGPSAVLAIATLALVSDRLTERIGSVDIAGLRGLAYAFPLSAVVIVAACLALGPLPLLGGAPVGGLVSLAGAWSDGRVVIALLGLVGLGGAMVGLGRLVFLLVTPAPERQPLGEQPIAIAIAALPLAVSVGAGILAFTAWDPAARAAIAVFGVRPRPTGGELLALPWYGVTLALVSLIATTLVGLALGARRARQGWQPKSRHPVVGRGEVADGPAMPALPGLARAEAGHEGRPLLARTARLGHFALWAVAEGLAVLEGRYYMATVLVLSLWALIVFLG